MAEKRARRKIIRQLTTKLFSKIEGELKMEDSFEKYDILSEILQQLIEKKERLQILDSEVEKGLTVEELETEVEASEEYQEKIITWKTKIEKCLKSKTGSSNFVNKIDRQDNGNNVRLPKLELQKFGGEISSWNDWWGSFEGAIHKNETLSPVEKFCYLKGCLVGQAFSAISGFSNAAENYEAAVDLLKTRFGRPDLLVSTHMNRLLNLEPLSNSHPKALRKLYDSVVVEVRNLNSLNVTSGAYGYLLAPVILKLLPEEIVLLFNKFRKSKNKNDIDELIEFLREEIESREATCLIANVHHKQQHNVPREYFKFKDSGNPRYRNKSRNYMPSAANLVTNNTSSGCVFCLKNHESDKCDELSLDEKRNKLKISNHCFKCFKRGHFAKACWSKNSCEKCGSRNHRTSICKQSTTKETPLETLVSSVSNTTNNVLLQTCVAHVKSNHKANYNVTVLVDGGSQRSFVLKSVADDLKLPVVRKESLLLYSFGSKVPRKTLYDVVRISLQNVRYPHMEWTTELLVTNEISGARVNYPGKDLKPFLKEKGIELFNPVSNRVEVLLGADLMWEIVCTNRITPLDKQLVAIETVFGWTLHGKLNHLRPKAEETRVMNLHCFVEEESLNENLKRFWTLESLGINDKINYQSENDVEILSDFERDLEFINGRYETGLLWDERKLESRLASNWLVAKRRFDSLRDRLKTNPEFLSEYKEIVSDQMKAKVVENCTEITPKNSYYMPHREVLRESSSTTKLRIVFDASSKMKGEKSLNDCLKSGPNLNPSVLDVLLTFRGFKVAFCADIEKAFLQIGIKESDRDFLRFIWFNDRCENSFQILRMTRVTFGVKCSPFLLAATLKVHIKRYKEQNEAAFNMLNKFLYVDDLIFGGRSVEEAQCLAQDAVDILSDASMNLRKFNTNSKELRDLWINQGKLTEDGCTDSNVKVLGMIWDTKDDFLKLETIGLLKSRETVKITKRYILQVAAKLFDPLGFIAPYVIRVKCLLQELWELGLDWDQEIPKDQRVKWEIWSSEIEELKDWRLERGYFGNDLRDLDGKVEVHIFCDASPIAFGAVSYFRNVRKNKIEIKLILSKARVAPLKKLTLPRLELMSALIGARMASYLQRLFELKSSNIILWSDSTIACHWIRGAAKNWKPFVSNRIREIHELTDPMNWRHCPGKQNPADMLTRGVPLKTLIGSKLWRQGPPWLSTTTWPDGKIPELDVDHLLRESKKSFDVQSPDQPDVTQLQDEETVERQTEEIGVNLNPVELEPIHNKLLLKFSAWSRMQRILAWCLRFIENCKAMKERKFGFLTTEELRTASKTVIQLVQRQSFKSEIDALKRQKLIAVNSPIASLAPFLDSQGLLRVGGRLGRANLPEGRKHPIILPKDHHVTKVIIRHFHETHLHGGVNLVLTALATHYWIISGKRLVKSLIFQCTRCHRQRARTMTQFMADLPSARVNPSRVFSYVGTDFAGPFSLTTRKGRGVKSFKGYVCIFVCLNTKAVHIEFVSDLTAEAFIASLRRFTSRRGRPKEIWSDCGTNYTGAARELQRLTTLCLNSEQVQNHFVNESVKWRFNPPAAPHHGGIWEAAVKSFKTHLKRTVGEQILTIEEFLTLINQIEACLNSRPLTPMSLDDPENFEVLTPGHFLIGTALTALPDQDLIQDKLGPLQRWKLVQQILQRFWKKWSTDYLSSLQKRNKWVRPKENIKLNDLVLIQEDGVPSLRWKLGRVIELYPGLDGKIRVVKVKTVNGEYKRPIVKLSPLPMDG